MRNKTLFWLGGGALVELILFAAPFAWKIPVGWAVTMFVLGVLGLWSIAICYLTLWNSKRRRSAAAAPIVFGSPVQRALGHGESVWCIPVRLASTANHNNFSRCSVKTEFHSGDSPSLRWGDPKQNDSPQPETALNSAASALVPIVTRREPSEPDTAWLMTASYHQGVGGEPKYSYPANRSLVRFRLVVISDDGTPYVSPQQYRFRVPSLVSNGQFTLEIEYDV